MTTRHDPDGRHLPIKLDSTSNGEFMPVSPANRAAKRLAHDAATVNAKRLGVTRRFLLSACGAASTLLAFNRAHGTAGGFYDLKIFGLNAANVYGIAADEVKKIIARDRIAAEKMAYSEEPDPHFTTYGPKTRREFHAFGG